MYHDLDFSLLANILSDKPTIVDVGANRGQSIHSIKFARAEAVIHSFEPNPEFTECLDDLARQLQGVTVHHVGLGRSQGELEFFIPVIAGVRYLEETTMRLESLDAPWVLERFKARGNDLHFETFTAAIAVGDDFGLEPELIKIDVEGVESEVVEGFYRTIEKHRPIVLVENGDWYRLNPIMLELGYEMMMPNDSYDALVPFAGTRANTFYVHTAAPRS